MGIQYDEDILPGCNFEMMEEEGITLDEIEKSNDRNLIHENYYGNEYD